MRNRVITIVCSLVLITSLGFVVSVFSKSEKQASKSVARPDKCACSKSFQMMVNLGKNRIRPANFIWNCKCGESQCAVTGNLDNPAISCVKSGLL